MKAENDEMGSQLYTIRAVELHFASAQHQSRAHVKTTVTVTEALALANLARY
jgi:hypothetical protein